MPIRKINFDDSEQLELYNGIIDMAGQVYNINEKLPTKLSKRERINLERQKSHLIQRMHNNVTKLYGLEDLMKVL